MKIQAVITGDLVKSSKMRQEDFLSVLQSTHKTFDKINARVLEGKGSYQTFRGDSFQFFIPEPDSALLVALLIRTNLRKFAPLSLQGQKVKKVTRKTYSDARISIGIGTINYKADKISDSQGEAFEKSGRQLDMMKKEDSLLQIDTPWEDINKEFAVECKLADAIISQWTTVTSETIYHYLLYEENQQKLAEYYNIKQPAIHKRLVIYGKINSINTFISRYKELIKSRE